MRILTALILLLLVACAEQPPAQPVTIAPTIAPASISVGLDFGAADLPSILGDTPLPATPHFVTTSNSTLFADLASQKLSAILVHHIPEDAPEQWQNPVALDGVVLIVHPSNPVEDISLGQLQAIFSGIITNWQAVGGADQPITPVIRERGSGTRAIFNQRVMGSQRVTIDALIRPNPLTIRQTVAADPTAIGYVTLGALPRATTDATLAVRQLNLAGINANPTTVADQSYPLTVPLYWVSTTEPTGDLRALLGWLQSTQGQERLGVRFGRIR